MSEDVIRRIQKLLALSRSSGATEHEAALASEKIQEILAAHNIDMATVEAARVRGGVNQQPDAPEVREKTSHQSSAMYKYQRSLMEALAKNNFCMYFLDEEYAHSFGKQRKVKRHVLLGRKVNVIGTQLQYDYLVETMDRLLPYTGMEKRGKDALAWLDGCADRLVGRLRDLRELAEEASRDRAAAEATRARHPASAPGNSLVVLSDVYGTEEDLNQDALNGLTPGTTARNKREAAEAYAKSLAEWNAKREAIRVENPDLDERLINYMVSGWSRSRAEEVLELGAYAKPEKVARPETEAQRRKREEQARRADERYWQRQAKANERFSSSAYLAGRDAGKDIGLDAQIDRDKQKEIG